MQILAEVLKRTSSESFVAIVGLLCCFVSFVPLSSQLSSEEITRKNYGSGVNHIKGVHIV